MARCVVAESALSKYVSSLKVHEPADWSLGLLIGQSQPSRDYITLFVGCHIPDEVESAKRLSSVLINDLAIPEHSEEVTKMLVGGQSVVGLFIVSEEDAFVKYSAKCRSMLGAAIGTDGSPLWEESQREKPRSGLLIHICPKSHRIQCKLLKCDSNIFHPAELTYQSFISQWNLFQTEYYIDEHLYMTLLGGKKQKRLSLIAALRQISLRIQRASLLFNDTIRNPEDTFETQKSVKKVKHKSRGGNKSKGWENKQIDEVELGKVYRVSLLEPPSVCGEELTRTEVDSLVRIRGSVGARCLCGPSATVGECSEHLKRDLVASLLSRSHLLGEELAASEHSEVVPTPRRVFANVHGVPLVADYVYPEEEGATVLEGFRDILGLDDLKESDLELDFESFIASPDSLFNDSQDSPIETNCSSGSSIKGKPLWRRVYIAGSVGAALCAGISYIVLSSDLF